MNKSSLSLDYFTPKLSRNCSQPTIAKSKPKKKTEITKKLRKNKPKKPAPKSKKSQIAKLLKIVDEKLKKTFIQEKTLLNQHENLESRIRNLQENKGFKYAFDSNKGISGTMKKIIELRRYLDRFKELEKKEVEIEEIEHELGANTQDMSLDTRSSDNNYSVFHSKEVVQKQLLRNKICKIGFQEENFSLYSSFSKKQKLSFSNSKSDLETKLKDFSIQKEVFLIQETKVKLFRDKVVRKGLLVEKQKLKISKIFTEIEEEHKKNEDLKTELGCLTRVFIKKKNREKIDLLSFRVSFIEEKIGILKDSISEKKPSLKAHAEKVKTIEQKLCLRSASIKSKNELLGLLSRIETELKRPETSPKFSKTTEKKQKICELIKEAMAKEKEIISIENQLNDFLIFK